MRRGLVKTVRLAVAIVLLILLFTTGFHLFDRTKRLSQFSFFARITSASEHLHLNTSPLHFRLDDYKSNEAVAEAIRSKLHPDAHLYSGYASFIRTFGLERKVLDAPLSEKCSRFFSELSHRVPGWKMPTFDGFHDNISNAEGYFISLKEQYKNQWMNDHPDEDYVFTKEERSKVVNDFNEAARKTLKISHEMSDVTTIMRVFGKCFFNDDTDRDMRLYKKYSKKIYGFLGNKLPKFHHANSDTTITGALPRFDENNKFVGTIPYKLSSDNLVEFMRKNMNGKGIVLSANSDFQSDLLGLLRVLRATNNKLPIQIFHLGDLSENTQLILYYHATADIQDLIKKKTWENGKEILPDVELLKEYEKHGSEFPAQDLWFVDAGDCLSEFKDKFTWFYNKILAYYFNSFAEMIFMDTDAVPVVDTQYFFDSKEYTTTGTYFFKDRFLKERLKYQGAATFLSLSPVNKISVDSLFEIPLLTDKTLKNRYFSGWFHYQESGILAYNRTRHYNANLMILPLTIWNNVVCGMIYGDKEMYWLSMVMAGDEVYAFNNNDAAAVGRSFTDPKLKNQPHFAVHKVCTTHPGHVNDEGKLLWINSGFKYCKMNDWESDKGFDSFTTFSNQEMELLYDEPLTIEALVVPPPPPILWERGLPVHQREYDEALELYDYLQNDRGKNHLNFADETSLTGVQSGWEYTGVCLGYEYCAVDKIISYSKDKVYDYGKYYEYTKEETNRFRYYGKLWMDL